MRTAAFFDVDRTLIPNHTMERVFLPFLIRKKFVQTGDLARYALFCAKGLGRGDRNVLHENKFHLKNKDPDALTRLAVECFQNQIRPLISPAGREAIKKHQEQGHLVVLLSGTLMPLGEAIRQELGADVILAASLGSHQGRLNGTLAAPRPYGPEKARLAKEMAERHGLDLDRSFAYGDHRSDVHLLSVVGNPRAVNPDPKLRQEALRRGWPIVSF